MRKYENYDKKPFFSIDVPTKLFRSESRKFGKIGGEEGSLELVHIFRKERLIQVGKLLIFIFEGGGKCPRSE